MSHHRKIYFPGKMNIRTSTAVEKERTPKTNAPNGPAISRPSKQQKKKSNGSRRRNESAALIAASAKKTASSTVKANIFAFQLWKFSTDSSCFVVLQVLHASCFVLCHGNFQFPHGCPFFYNYRVKCGWRSQKAIIRHICQMTQPQVIFMAVPIATFGRWTDGRSRSRTSRSVPMPVVTRGELYHV